VLSRNGTAIASLSGTAYLDLGLAAGSNYCYSVVAVGAYGSSSPSASGCATTPAAGGALAWDAAGMAGASDGNGNWGSGPAMWWNGAANQVWSNNNLALFGAGATANCTVTITNNVTPSGLVFNANNGGNYMLAGSGGGVILSGNPVFTANDNSTISAVLQGSGGFTLTGSGALTLSVSETFTGATVVQAGTLLLNAYSALNSSPITIQSGATVSAVVSGGNTFQYYGKTLTVDSGGTLTLGNGSFSNLGGYLYLQGGATLGGSDSGSWGSWQINNSDSTIHVTNGSPVTAVISAQGLHGANGKSLIFNVADVTGDANVDLLVSGTLSTGEGDSSNYGITKNGAGTMALAGNNSYIGATLISAGTLQVDGSLGTNVVTVASGATLAGTGTVNGATTNLSGGTLAPGDNGVGTLAINNNLTLNSGSKAVLATSKNGGSVSNSQVMVSGRLALGGTLTVTNLGANALAAGDTLKLFVAGTFSGGFTTLTLPNLSAGLLWYTNTLSANGTLSVSNVLCTLTYTAGANGILSGITTQTVIYATSGSAVTAAPNANCRFVNWSDGSMANPRADASVTNNVTVTANFAAVNLSPPAITNGVTGGKLSLAWASDHTGWRLLAQTNHLAGGLSSNTNDWGTVAGSSATNQVSVPLNTTNPAEFYRLVYP
jgi:autotransporter-associated beta strand protein